ncbi:MerR family transcriptional regulator [Bacillus cereus group sp. LD113LC]|uniref:MerR family transcriptional regulator n=1 Tax=Bacillus cereus group TaxID=86661 RepID=UPI0007AB98D0|nr:MULTISPECIES: MerR family transcriptional regulator [unclassified Bacillus cereus group]KZD56968.1 putative DNA binding protein [Bacillus cereus]KZD58462.1 putative DNA binding protein [Bacillus cereus]MDA1542671.1 MerR family transcriptional regulator [Bacillus cereus group sp. TH244-1LC]MDA1753129.1 MerR family transcriptional regulator [Bacillus cereus group sp. LD113LC]
MSEFGTFAKEVALHLDINVNTLRRWSIELEKHGYKFERNDKNNRLYYERDILVLSDMQRMIEKTQSLEIAGKSVVASFNERKNAEKTIAIITNKDENSDKISFTKEELEQYTKRIVEETSQRTAEVVLQKFNDSLEKRDRELVQGIRQTMEDKRLEIAAAVEKQSFWARLFSGGKNKAKSKG